jgi:hypothetical protein
MLIPIPALYFVFFQSPSKWKSLEEDNILERCTNGSWSTLWLQLDPAIFSIISKEHDAINVACLCKYAHAGSVPSF